MKLLIKIGIGLAFVVGLVLVVALFIPNELKYEKSIEIEASVDDVWGNVNSLADLDHWSPWNDLDPNMEKKWTGVDGTVGASQSWVSEVKDIGEGSQTIVKITPNKRLDTKLKFIKPLEGESKAFVALVEKEGKTVVTWGFESEMSYPFNMMKLTMDMEKEMGEIWESGLTKLKTICETPVVQLKEAAVEGAHEEGVSEEAHEEGDSEELHKEEGAEGAHEEGTDS